MFKPGDWIHTEKGIGQCTLSFPCYYQFWEKIRDDKYRAETFDDNEELATTILGDRKQVGQCYSHIIYMKRLCDHEGNPKKRIMAFQSKAYENDTASEADIEHINAALKDEKLKERFDTFKMKYQTMIRQWRVNVSEEKVDEVISHIKSLNDQLAGSDDFTVRALYESLKAGYDVDIVEFYFEKMDTNLSIFTHHHSVNSENYYNSQNEEVICKIITEKET